MPKELLTEESVEKLHRKMELIKVLSEEAAEEKAMLMAILAKRRRKELRVGRFVLSIGKRINLIVNPFAYFKSLGGDIVKLLSSVVPRKEGNKEQGLMGVRDYLSKMEIESISDPVEYSFLVIKEDARVTEPNTKVNFA